MFPRLKTIIHCRISFTERTWPWEIWVRVLIMDCDGTGRVFLHLFITDMLHYRQDKANPVFGLAARVRLILPSQNTARKIPLGLRISFVNFLFLAYLTTSTSSRSIKTRENVEKNIYIFSRVCLGFCVRHDLHSSGLKFFPCICLFYQFDQRSSVLPIFSSLIIQS